VQAVRSVGRQCPLIRGEKFTSWYTHHAKSQRPKTLTEGTRRQYRLALRDFETWYRQTYGASPDPTLLTGEELREWQSHLTDARGLKAATVNQRLAAVKALARHCGRLVAVKGVRRVEQPVEPLNGRELGRLFAVAEGERWLDKRNTALLSLLARTGLRVSEVCDLAMGDVTLNTRSGAALVRKGKGVKERQVALSKQARQALQTYLEARPDWPTEQLFFSRTGKPLDTRDVQRLVEKLARLAGIARQVTPHTLRHTFATRFLRQGGDPSADLRTGLAYCKRCWATRTWSRRRGICIPTKRRCRRWWRRCEGPLS